MTASKPKSRTARLRAADKHASNRIGGHSRPDYHHGNLKEALLQAAVDIAREAGPDSVSIREAARRAGVSPGAPFRHFPTRTALMTAIAEDAMHRLRAEVETSVDKLPSADPQVRLCVMGRAYLLWTIENPVHFEIISSRHLIDFESSESLRQDNERLKKLMTESIESLHSQGRMTLGDAHLVAVASRALMYGLARMRIDGHFAQWDVADKDAYSTSEAIVDLFVAAISDHDLLAPTGRR